MRIRKVAGKLVAGALASLVGFGAAWGADADTDGIEDAQDNCMLVANPSQLDTDSDAIGNICDPDIAVPNDLFVNFLDLNIIKASFFSNPNLPTWNADADFNGDNLVNFQDLIIMQSFFFSAPGPSGPLSVPTYTADVQPVFAEKCQPCHTGLGFGGHNIATDYNDAFLPADNSDCDELNVGQCTIIRIQSGEMPQGADCTGDPAQDAGNAGCLTQDQQDTVQAWIDAGLPQ